MSREYIFQRKIHNKRILVILTQTNGYDRVHLGRLNYVYPHVLVLRWLTSPPCGCVVPHPLGNRELAPDYSGSFMTVFVSLAWSLARWDFYVASYQGI